eukprot:4665132-Pyramimonas_sp.AAC.1
MTPRGNGRPWDTRRGLQPRAPMPSSVAESGGGGGQDGARRAKKSTMLSACAPARPAQLRRGMH